MIGRHMKAYILSQGFNVVSVSRESWNLFDWKSHHQFDDLFQGADGIFHFGAALPSKSGLVANQEYKCLFDVTSVYINPVEPL